MGAIVMDGAVIESNSIIGAGSVVLEGSHIESGTIYAGVPAKKVKDLNLKIYEEMYYEIFYMVQDIMLYIHF